MHKLAYIAVLISGLLPTQAAASAELATSLMPEARLVGEGRLRYMIWDVYDARLYAPNGIYNADAPILLTLTYLRDLDGEDIAERSVQEMREQGYTNEVKLAAWFGEMKKIFPDVQKGTVLSGYYRPHQATSFYHGNDLVGTVRDPDFGPHFFSIWLSPRTTEPALRSKLLGE